MFTELQLKHITKEPAFDTEFFINKFQTGKFQAFPS